MTTTNLAVTSSSSKAGTPSRFARSILYKDKEGRYKEGETVNLKSAEMFALEDLGS